MQNDEEKPIEVPTLEAVETELKRVRYKSTYRSTLRSTIYALIVVAAIATIISTFFIPCLRIYGTSMTPTLVDNEIICCVKSSNFEPGDIIAFYCNNKVLVKRVIGEPGDWIDIAEDGTVSVNNVELDEPYLNEKAFGECDIELPYQVPENRLFVMGDHRKTSADSRSSTVGCVAQEQIVGKFMLRIWPLNRLGTVD